MEASLKEKKLHEAMEAEEAEEDEELRQAMKASKEDEELRQAMEASLKEQKLHEAMEASKEANELHKAMKASLKEKKLHEAMEAEELDKAMKASLEEQKLLEAMEAEELHQAILAIQEQEQQESKKGRKPIIPLKASIYMNPSSLKEIHALQEIRNDVSHQPDIPQPNVHGKLYIPPPDDFCDGIVKYIIQLGIVTYAFVVQNDDGSISVVRINEISRINGIVRGHLKPDIGDSVFWVKKYSGESAGGGTVFQYPHGTFWKSTPAGYRWEDPEDPNNVEHSRLYLS
jgi:hypothetical protein